MTDRPASKPRAGSVPRGGFMLIGGSKTFEDSTHDRHHSLATAAVTIADAQSPARSALQRANSNTDPPGATTTQTGTSRKVRLSVRDSRRGTCVGRVDCRGWHGHWLDTRYPGSDGYLLDGLWARHGRCASSRGTDRRLPGSEGWPSVVLFTSREGGGQ